MNQPKPAQPAFTQRHLGSNTKDQQEMLAAVGVDSMEALIDQVVPNSIRATSPLELGQPNLDSGLSEEHALHRLRGLADKNLPFRSFIGQGYYNCHTPKVILRNLLENPAWYTAYTPYQPEISQGRLEALLNFQTMVTDLTGMALANASLLDEATAAAEAMALSRRMAQSKGTCFFVDQDVFPQTLEVIRTRAKPLGIEILVGDPYAELEQHDWFGVLIQYPGCSGEIADAEKIRDLISAVHAHKALAVVATDLLALTLLKSPGELGADVAVGSAQRFGVSLGFGGPHAGFMATQDAFKRSLPGRMVGVSIDANGNPAYRLALQTREQHIRREKATSNICTAQVLLAVIASMYAVYHGPDGLKLIARRVQALTASLAEGLQSLGLRVVNIRCFDTISVHTGKRTAAIHAAARKQALNLRQIDDAHIGVSLDETVGPEDIRCLLSIFSLENGSDATAVPGQIVDCTLPESVLRDDEFLSHPVFHSYHTETEMMRYLRRLADKDIALDRAMIPLGSCTMKLNAAVEMIPVTWDAFANVHPFAPPEQVQGYLELIHQLEQMLCAITGYDAVSLQPNAGSQGEYAGLLAIQAYHQSRGEGHRNICLIPSSAHGTNPASAQMCNMRVVVVACDAQGNVDLDDLQARCEEHSSTIAAIMVTYPSTHGVFEEQITQICDLVHSHGGQVYMDGANLNAMVGLCYPGKFGGDVSHLNLHKTFCIPHGGGGPGVGPIAARSHLADFLPSHAHLRGQAGEAPVGAVSAAPWGSAGILPISWMYLQMMGEQGLVDATQTAILNANYVAERLRPHYPVLYTGKNGRVAHECIIDLRPIKEVSGISVEDVAKRLIDFGFHAPTMSFPVAGTLMIEPTESESKAELDRFCDAMMCIRAEIGQVERGELTAGDNPLVNSPHTAETVCADDWQHAYSREQAAYPVASLRRHKYWSPVGRVDSVYGDKNLLCSCPSLDEYAKSTGT